MTNPTWTIAKVAEKFKISRNTCYREVERKNLVGHRIGGEIRFTDEQIEQWLERKKTA